MPMLENRSFARHLENMRYADPGADKVKISQLVFYKFGVKPTIGPEFRTWEFSLEVGDDDGDHRWEYSFDAEFNQWYFSDWSFTAEVYVELKTPVTEERVRIDLITL